MIRLYRFIEKNLGTDYSNIYYESCDESVVGNVCINIYPGSGIKKSVSGREMFESVKASVTVLCGPTDNVDSEQAVQNAHTYLRTFVNKMETEPNCLDGFEVISVQGLGNPSNSGGRNGYGILQVYCNIEIKCII